MQMESHAAAAALTMAVVAASVALGAGPTEEKTMQHASGSFDVQMTPEEPNGRTEDDGLGRFALDKRYHGGLEGRALGQMLSAGSPGEGSAGYVAIERFVGKLDGREGTFALMHRGTMSPAGQTLEVAVVPGSGSGELAGISGTLDIRIEGKQHFYDLAYELAAKP